MRTDQKDMFPTPRPPSPEDVAPFAKAAVKLITDVAPAAMPTVALLMSYVGLINALLATIAGLLGIWYMIVKIRRAHKGLPTE